MKQTIVLFFLFALLQGCAWEIPVEKKLKICQKPTAILATPDAANPLKYTLSLSGSTADIASMAWSISGSSDQVQTGYYTKPVTLTYNTNYTITAAITTACNETLTLQLPLSINSAVASFTFTGGNCQAPCEVVFTNTSTNATSYLWDFGDNTTSTETNPRHTFTKGGTFYVTLSAKGNGPTSLKAGSISIMAPIPTKQWDKTFGGSDDDNLTSAIATPDGGYLLAGYARSSTSGEKSESSKGENDYWVVKINADGAKQWDKTFGGSKDDELSSVITTSDEGFLLGGSSVSNISGDKSENSKINDNGLSYDYWIVKINSNGIKQWDKTLGGRSNEVLQSIITTADGGYLLAGYSDSNISGDKSGSSRGKWDYWVVKVDANGGKQWDKTFGGSGDDELLSAVMTSDGGYIVAGYSISDASSDKSENTKGNFDYWVIKISANGEKQWDKTFGGSGDDKLQDIIVTPDGGYLLGGYSFSNISGDKSENTYGYNDYWVIKISANGEKQWDKTFGGNGGDALNSTISTSDGGYLLTGFSGSNDRNTIKGGVDQWIVKIDVNGIKQWDKTFGGSDFDDLKTVLSSTDGGYLLGGSSKSNISGDKSENSRGGYDYWIVKIK